MNKRHYEHTLPNIRGSLSNTYNTSISLVFMGLIFYFSIIQRLAMFLCGNMLHWSMFWPIS